MAAMRLVLAAAGLLVIYIHPAEPDRFVALTYAELTLYTLYSALLYLLAWRGSSLGAWISTWAHWADLGWYTLLVSLSSGTNSIFFFGFIFAILVASFRGGYVEGLRVTIASAALFTVVGYLFTPREGDFDLNRYLLRPVFLLVLGYMMAYWGGFEMTLKQRLALLQEVAAISNPRFGVDRTIGALMERLRAFYNADSCLIALCAVDDASSTLRISRAGGNTAGLPQSLPTELARQWLTPLEASGAVYASCVAGRWRVLDHHGGARASAVSGAALARIGTLLEARSFISAPLDRWPGGQGRLFLASHRSRAFGVGDVQFLLQVVAQVAPAIENIRLVDQLASDAADAERRRIARDLHDSIIQPYIGLQIGLAATRSKAIAADARLRRDLDRLLDLTTQGINELRVYVQGLRDGPTLEHNVLAALGRFATKWSSATGLQVEIKADDSIVVNDRLAAEVFQMVAEGLSNVRRHTGATGATVTLGCKDDTLRVWIENDLGVDGPPEPFLPRSIAERAAALGGRVEVVSPGLRSTRVVIEIPL